VRRCERVLAPRLPTGGDNEVVKAKELEDRRQVALTVTLAAATTSAPMGDNCPSMQKAPRSRPYRSEDIQERSRRPRDARCHVQTSGAAGSAGEAMGVADLRTA
jgi:hypothetical protein